MKFTEDDLWLTVDGDIVTAGLTSYALEQVGEIIYVDLPEVGASLRKGEEFMDAEAMTTVLLVTAPLDGVVFEVNPALKGLADVVNEDPTGAGWLFKLRVSDLSQLDDYMDESGYDEYNKKIGRWGFVHLTSKPL